MKEAAWWFGIDVDGTIADSDGIPEETQALLRWARQQGAWIILASGRRPHYLREISRRLGLDSPVIALDGAWLENSRGEVLMTVPMAAKIVDRLRQEADRRGLRVTLIGEEDVCYKLLMAGDPAELRALQQDTWPAVRVVNDFTREIEWVSMESSKGHALTTLIRYFGRPAHLIAFGNDTNDREMFHVADQAYALPSAPQALKDVATRVLEPIETQPVARVIRRLLWDERENESGAYPS
jgi:hydroxymethylpyrimidine pyrophosphatase-like HAD family hydrolase